MLNKYKTYKKIISINNETFNQNKLTHKVIQDNDINNKYDSLKNKCINNSS